jgi:hypothetical protein
MIEANEYDLIEFFGVLPQAQPPEEKEFFGITTFEVKRKDLRLSFSFSTLHPGLSLRLQPEQTGDDLFAVELAGLRDMKVETRDPSSAILLCRTVGTARVLEIDHTNQIIHEVIVRVDPAISVRITMMINEYQS